MRGKPRDPMGNNNKNQMLGTCDEKDNRLGGQCTRIVRVRTARSASSRFLGPWRDFRYYDEEIFDRPWVVDRGTKGLRGLAWNRWRRALPRSARWVHDCRRGSRPL